MTELKGDEAYSIRKRDIQVCAKRINKYIKYMKKRQTQNQAKKKPHPFIIWLQRFYCT